MNDNRQFDPERSAAFRQLLVARVAEDTRARRPRRHAGLILGAVVFGSVASLGAAAFAATTIGWIALPSSTPGGEATFAQIPEWPTNAAGQTYGVQGDSPTAPDLIRTLGVNSDGNDVEGYVLSSDLEQPLPTSPSDALQQQAEEERKYPNGREVPLYESDGTTVIGTFHIGG